MNPLQVIAVTVVGYLLGAIPFAVIIAKRHGVDIMKEGSGNPGATNVTRSVGKRAGNFCFVMDFLKGLAAAGIPLLPFMGASDPIGLGVLGLIAAIIGHSYSVFIGFKGGKGVAVTMGGLLALAPIILIIGLIVWVGVFYSSKYVSLASLCFGISLPVLGIGFEKPAVLIIFLVGIAVLIVFRHRANIQRLFAGTEHRFSKDKKNAK
ncbi:glycerol-3-phosphate 1-O-acyltransferase PlsY [Rubellicoccus peritrichatus]|uniref:Glycerol-3-phosphate acyltransferase n=1 Tax=Rubellicoccus peritrichatus TaxID=3080537 RepID=A0AAQ3QWD9_9BACT|nr:glycerol-3-phosphate 1-O-acyltransferase PlsY [Puniceicoccus sp. CR14]WOO41792.1 glycerol-3-phosphate 1-O-acyltransferase PlsY [Puniceicoccus sp. CR14]